jgi:SAM-dependent methyltransferase
VAEFTGERVIPGQVDADLWNEHVARYAFAARLARAKRVLDAGCGSGYGSARLAEAAREVAGIDLASEAVDYARAHYHSPNLSFAQASCAALPFRDASIDLVVGFEVIEHLAVWKEFLGEVRRVLAPGGQFIVSTPNQNYYGDSRRLAGPNPYHEHEFGYDEFHAELAALFPHVSMYLENHAQGIVFRPVVPESASLVKVESGETGPADAHFFVAVCALASQTGAPTFVYLPTTSNVLRERELHIAALEQEIVAKDQWLEKARQDHVELLEMFRQQTAQLEERNHWAGQLNQEIQENQKAIQELLEQSARERAETAQMVQGYEAKIAGLEAENEKNVAWVRETETRLSAEIEAKCQELARAVELLHETEKIVEERTGWALRIEQERQQVEAMLSGLKASRWVKLGRTFGLGPELGNG